MTEHDRRAEVNADRREQRADASADRREKRADAVADRLTLVAQMLETAVAELNDLMDGIKAKGETEEAKPEW